MSWRHPLADTPYTLVMTATEYKTGVCRKQRPSPRKVGDVCKQIRKGSFEAFGIGTRIRVENVTEEGLVIFFRKL